MTTPPSTLSIDELPDSVGRTFGPTDWLPIEQTRIDQFAEATGDHQWIHVDPEAAKNGPFGATIAHGYLTLSLSSFFAFQLLAVDGISMGINYGVDKVRFPAPVIVGSKLRARAEIMEVTPIDGGYQVKTKLTMETEGAGKPACVIESLSRYLR
jgi:acyl dehydratase